MITCDEVGNVTILEELVINDPQCLRNFTGLVKTLVDYAPPASEMTTPSVDTPTLSFFYDPTVLYTWASVVIGAEPGPLSREYLVDLGNKLTIANIRFGYQQA